MGNIVITIHHPTSLDHGIPYLESGRIVAVSPSMIRMEKKPGTACGCGGRVTFKRNVKETTWTYKITKQNSANFKIGHELVVRAANKPEAEAKLTAEFGITDTETRESTVMIKYVISDYNRYSELYCYVDFEGPNNGVACWHRNLLELDLYYRWVEDSEMIIDIIDKI